MTDAITVVIPTIPPRRHRLASAMWSVGKQTLLPTDVVVQDDPEGFGAAATRHVGLMRVRTPWVAFLDDDDRFYPEHLAHLLETALESEADYVWSYFDLVYPDGTTHNENDPLGHFGKQWDPEHPIQTTITTLVRTDLAQSVGFIHPPHVGFIEGQKIGEDYQFTTAIAATGARMIHRPERTWIWNHWGYNLSGRPWKQPEMLPLAIAGVDR